MKQIGDKAYEFLRDAYVEDVRDLLSKPIGGDWHDYLVEVGKDCGFDFWEIVNQCIDEDV